ncbi:cytochrome P450 [Auriscalpium vulgare]|uniref:Cytochrome P450 n=1 Tax=Auriscalpium vulgare TaxID=40419 RepID=A0ACB8S4W3_9AGAM|nr:cytochrome P450 [Auriscalpium vulgare]
MPMPSAPSLSTALVVPLLLLAAYILHPLLFLLRALHRSPLKRLPSPPSPSLLLGNLAAIADQENTDILRTWADAYGPTYTYRGFIGGRRLLTTDPAALAWILGHAYDFPKPDFVTESLAAMAAGREGLLTVDGDVHRRQRKILSHAFSAPYIKSLIPVFADKAQRLRDIFLTIADTPDAAPNAPLPSPPTSPAPTSPVDSFAILRSLDPVRPPGGNSKGAQRKCAHDLATASAHNTPQYNDTRKEEGRVVDVLAWLGRATLDVIGEAGFGYHFNSLPPPSLATKPEEFENDNELARAFGVIFSTARKFRVLSVLQVWFPVLRRFQPNNKTMQSAQATMRRIGLQLIEERKAAASPPSSPSGPSPPYSLDPPRVDAGVDAKTSNGRDILSVLVRANTASEPGQALTITEILSQISTFLAAGHETTASALSWTLFALAQTPALAVQATLRAALRDIPEGDFDAVLRLPILEHVVREALRLHAPVGSTMRVYKGAADEVVVPVSRGVRVWVPKGGALRRTWRTARRWVRREGKQDGEDGVWRTECGVRMMRGDIVTIPIQAVNRDVEVWGPDAREFRPSRWEVPPPAAEKIPGLYAHLLTFLNGSPIIGNRACIGYKFALTEIKIFLYYLLRDIEFTLDPDVVIEKRVNIVTRPFVASAPEMGNQMPLRIRRVPP